MKDRTHFEKKDNELLDFARTYLSESFPNPERQGCPPDGALRSLALTPKLRLKRQSRNTWQVARRVLRVIRSCSPN